MMRSGLPAKWFATSLAVSSLAYTLPDKTYQPPVEEITKQMACLLLQFNALGAWALNSNHCTWRIPILAEVFARQPKRSMPTSL
jgi:hypothetical protein